jgi:hypothetical protein
MRWRLDEGNAVSRPESFHFPDARTPDNSHRVEYGLMRWRKMAARRDVLMYVLSSKPNLVRLAPVTWDE